jgi:hypothetical protein
MCSLDTWLAYIEDVRTLAIDPASAELLEDIKAILNPQGADEFLQAA